MSVGLMALLDDVAAIAKVAAASLDDVASQAAKAGVKAAGVVIDDTAVTPGRHLTSEQRTAGGASELARTDLPPSANCRSSARSRWDRFATSF